MSVGIEWQEAEWPAPKGVRALTTQRQGGVSGGPFSQLNLGSHCGDDPDSVAENRRRIASLLPSSPAWLRQVHSDKVVCIDDIRAETPIADAAFSCIGGRVCAVLTADCLPVVLCDRQAKCVAVAHAGWRGLAAGVLQATVQALPAEAGELLAWLGPAIGPAAYEVGEDVLQTFTSSEQDCFEPSGQRWMMDMYRLARRRLAACGVTAVFGGNECTWTDSDRYFSYRRDGSCGRMATLAWLEQGEQ